MIGVSVWCVVLKVLSVTTSAYAFWLDKESRAQAVARVKPAGVPAGHVPRAAERASLAPLGIALVGCSLPDFPLFLFQMFPFCLSSFPQPEQLGQMLETGGYLVNGLPPLVNDHVEEASKAIKDTQFDG